MIAETNCGYAELRNSEGWADEQTEPGVWDGTLSDGV